MDFRTIGDDVKMCEILSKPTAFPIPRENVECGMEYGLCNHERNGMRSCHNDSTLLYVPAAVS